MSLYESENENVTTLDESTENIKNEEIIGETDSVEVCENEAVVSETAEVSEQTVTDDSELPAESESDAVSDVVSEQDIDEKEEQFKESLKEKRKKRRRKKKVKSFVSEVRSFIIIIVIAFIAALLINVYLIRSSDVVGTSMYPTLQSGQTVLISRAPYFFSEPERGDIIVFDAKKQERTFWVDMKFSLRNNVITQMFTDEQPMLEEGEFYIKRVIGVAGDVITVKDYKMYINGVPLEDKGYKINDDGTAYYAYEGMSWTVTEGNLFVMGDNRINSKDSRMMGLIPTNSIMGKVVKQ